MSNELNKLVRDLAEIRAMENVAKNAKLNQEILKGQEKHIKLEEERLEIEKKKILVLEAEVRERESAERKRETIKEKRKQIRKDGVAIDEILRNLSALVEKDINSNEDIKFRAFILNELCQTSFVSFEKESAIFEDLEDLKFSSNLKSQFHELSDSILAKLDKSYLDILRAQLSQLDRFVKAYVKLNKFCWWSGLEIAKQVPLKEIPDENPPVMTTKELEELSGVVSDLSSIVDEGPLTVDEMVSFSGKLYSKMTKREIEFYEGATGGTIEVLQREIFLKGSDCLDHFDSYVKNMQVLIKSARGNLDKFFSQLERINLPSRPLQEAEIAVNSLYKIKEGKFQSQIELAIERFNARKTEFINKFDPKSGELVVLESTLHELEVQIKNFETTNRSGEIFKELISKRKQLNSLIAAIKEGKKGDLIIMFSIAFFVLVFIFLHFS
jgi:hypothetical protein